MNHLQKLYEVSKVILTQNVSVNNNLYGKLASSLKLRSTLLKDLGLL